MLLTALGVRALDHDDVVDLGRLVEQGLHLGLDLGVVDALFGAEHDRAHRAGALAPEVVVEDVEAGARLDVGQVELVAERITDGARYAEAEDEDRQPEPEDELPAVVAPGAESGEHERCLLGRVADGSRGGPRYDGAAAPNSSVGDGWRMSFSRYGRAPCTSYRVEPARAPGRRAKSAGHGTRATMRSGNMPTTARHGTSSVPPRRPVSRTIAAGPRTWAALRPRRAQKPRRPTTSASTLRAAPKEPRIGPSCTATTSWTTPTRPPSSSTTGMPSSSLNSIGAPGTGNSGDDR